MAENTFEQHISNIEEYRKKKKLEELKKMAESLPYKPLLQVDPDVNTSEIGADSPEVRDQINSIPNTVKKPSYSYLERPLANNEDKESNIEPTEESQKQTNSIEDLNEEKQKGFENLINTQVEETSSGNTSNEEEKQEGTKHQESTEANSSLETYLNTDLEESESSNNTNNSVMGNEEKEDFFIKPLEEAEEIQPLEEKNNLNEGVNNKNPEPSFNINEDISTETKEENTDEVAGLPKELIESGLGRNDKAFKTLDINETALPTFEKKEVVSNSQSIDKERQSRLEFIKKIEREIEEQDSPQAEPKALNMQIDNKNPGVIKPKVEDIPVNSVTNNIKTAEEKKESEPKVYKEKETERLIVHNTKEIEKELEERAEKTMIFHKQFEKEDPLNDEDKNTDKDSKENKPIVLGREKDTIIPKEDKAENKFFDISCLIVVAALILLVLLPLLFPEIRDQIVEFLINKLDAQLQ